MSPRAFRHMENPIQKLLLLVLWMLPVVFLSLSAMAAVV